MTQPIRLLEFHVAHDCNLTCAGCSHFSPLAARQDVSAEELERDVRAAAAALQPAFVHILGGEPLLNRELPRLLALVRAAFPLAAIKVVTNGVLFPRTSPDLCAAMLASGVTLAVSIYPGVKVDRAAIESRCAAAGLPFEFWEQDTFLEFFDPEGRQDPAAARRQCPMGDACNVRDGRIFPCPVAAWADLGGLPYEPGDGVPLDGTAGDPASVLSDARITSQCRHCRPDAVRRPHRLDRPAPPASRRMLQGRHAS